MKQVAELRQCWRDAVQEGLPARFDFGRALISTYALHEGAYNEWQQPWCIWAPTVVALDLATGKVDCYGVCSESLQNLAQSLPPPYRPAIEAILARPGFGRYRNWVWLVIIEVDGDEGWLGTCRTLDVPLRVM